MMRMRWFRLGMASTVLAGAASLMLVSPALATGGATDPAYSFSLAPANTAVAPAGGMMASAGDSISVKGSGTFDPGAGTVTAKGTFVHYSSTGAVICKGTWRATGFGGFTDFGSDGQGDEGGVLSIVVTHYCTTLGMTMTGIPMTVTSTVNAPAGYTEGTTVGDFTTPTGGGVEIGQEQ